MVFKNCIIPLRSLMLSSLFIMLSSAVWAVPPATGEVFDDFEDGDTSDWGFFGGNNAGGGGGPAGDRPKEGSYYFSTGWGGDGTASGFYGGAFKNLPNGSQLTLPADPWFNVWVFNQSDATADSYTLEITIREDLNGDGWTNGAEDSFQVTRNFTSTSFDDEWVLFSAPVSSFTNLGTGGNGIFDGNLDEMVLVIAGVQGGPGASVEVDFDQFTFTSGGPAAIEQVVFDDMEHGDPFGNGWFAFGGSVGGGGIVANNTDLPPSDGGSFSLETGWGSGGVPGFYGGFGRTHPTDASGTAYFNFWINPDASQDYTLEINLQEDDNSDGAMTEADDDEFQFNCVISPAGPCAVSGGGWQLVSIPLDDFFDDNSFFFGGNGVLDPTPPAQGGNGELINVIFAVIGSSGSDVNFRTDYWEFTLAEPGPEEPSIVIDDFESGLPSGVDGDGVPIGFYTFSDGSPVSLATTSAPPAPVPGSGAGNNVMAVTLDVAAFAGYIHGFENTAVDTWVPQDWSGSEGISLWFYGQGSGTTIFIDVLDNRNPGSTTDDAERWTVGFNDDFTGWQLLEFPFASFTRKEVGNGAPNDGFGLFEVHGYAVGTLATPGEITYYLDQVSLYGVAEPPTLTVQFSTQVSLIEEGTTGDVGVKLNRPMNASDPAQVSIDFATEPAIAVPGDDYTPTSGTLTFVNGGADEQSFPLETFDNSKFTGGKRIGIRLSNPVDVERGTLFQGSVLIDENDPYDSELIDDFEQGAFLLEGDGLLSFDSRRVTIGGPDERPGQDVVENVLALSILSDGAGYEAQIMDVASDLAALLPASDKNIGRALGSLEDALDPNYWVNGFILEEQHGKQVFDEIKHAVTALGKVKKGEAEVSAAQDAIDDLVAISASLALTAIDIALSNEGDSADVDKALGEIAKAEDALADGKPGKAVNYFRKAWQEAIKSTKAIDEDDFVSLATIVHDFALGQDWTGTESLNFWFKGTGSGEQITLVLKDNRAPDPGPAGWNLVWSDEFDGEAGEPPNPANWSYELGDVNPGGSNGWGNEELQYYTDDTQNVATDGNGNLVITIDQADPSLECYYGPCEYESGRLISQNKAEFAYGRIESRILVPEGGDGLWPAFWSLGTDIARNPWPGAGEIDFMEYVSRLPNEIFGTIHGPGYSGGGSFGGIYDFGLPVADNYHTFTVEWEPNRISWYVDGILYHEAEPADVPGPWVFEKPFFLLLNLAIGGNFGGSVDPGLVLPQDYIIDYVRVYQGPDSAERFETTFTDSSDTWQQVSIPLTEFVRSEEQPDGAPDDGLSLNEVWGYGFEVPYPAAGTFLIDQVRTIPIPPPSSLVVTNLNDSGPGSLREALMLIVDGGTVTFDPALAGGTIGLTSGQLAIDSSVTIDGSDAPLVTVSGSGLSRVFQVAAGAVVAINDLVISDGVGAPQGGGILNYGNLSLDRVTVINNTETSGGPASFDLGGGGIYNGDSSTLNLIDSTVSNNATLNQPGGGIYAFFNSTVNITGSTISNNTGADVAGGLRSLANVNIVNSTFSGNTSTVWHGGGIFHTDGNLTVTHSTFSGNNAPAGTASGILVATFGAPATATLTNNVLEGNGGAFACAIEGGGAASITSGGGNIDSDNSCNLIAAGDQPATDPLLGPLADNGGTTLTHAPAAGSPAIDAAGAGACTATDQRGVARPQGAGCDVGSVELE